MQTMLIVPLLAALAAPAAPQNPRALPIDEVLRVVETTVDQAARVVETAVEEAARTVERAMDESRREIARAVQQTERERERAERDRERAREQAERDRERARDQAERNRERAADQAERDRERAAEQAERDRERAAAQREREARTNDRRRGQAKQIERISKTLRIGGSGELDVTNISGNITITRGSGNDAVVEIVKTAYGRDDADAKELLKLVQVDIVERGTRGEIRTRYPGEEMRRGGRRNYDIDVDITIAAPQGARVHGHSVSGSLTARDIKGEVMLESVSGAIRIANGGRVASAKSISGSVEVVETDIDGTLEASTASGQVTLRRIKARAIDAGSISGTLVLEDVQSERVEVQTVSGDVRFSGPLVRSGRYELNSHSGSIVVAVPGNSGFEIEAASFSGSVQSDFPVNSGGRTRPRGLRGVYGDGSAVLEVNTFSGSITINKR